MEEQVQALLARIQELEAENRSLKATQKELQRRIGEIEGTPEEPAEPAPRDDSLEAAAVQLIEIDSLSQLQDLFKRGLEINATLPSRGTCLIHEAMRAGGIKVLNFLCTKGANLNAVAEDGNSPLTLGAELSKHDAMCILLQQSRGRVQLDFQNRSGMSALQIAVKNGNKEIVSLLIEHGADINVTTVLGDNILKMAQRAGHQEIVLLLVSAGASLR